MVRKLCIPLVILVAMLLAACGGDAGSEPAATEDAPGDSPGAETPATAENPPEFIIGSVLDPNINIPLLVAQEQGFFDDHGVPATVQLFPSGREITTAIAGGSIEFGATGGVPGTILAATGTEIEMVSRLGDISYELAIGTLPSTGITVPEDFDGATVAATFGTVSQYLVLAFAEEFGIPLDSFEMVNLGPADQLNALQQGSVDVVSVWEPFTTRLVEDFDGTILSTAIESHMPGLEGEVSLVGDPGILYGDSGFLSEYPNTTQSMLLAIQEAVVWTDENRDEAAAIAANALDTTEEAMLVAIDHLVVNFMLYDDYLFEELQAEADFLHEQEIIPGEFDAASWMNPSFMEEALPDLVTYSGGS